MEEDSRRLKLESMKRERERERELKSTPLTRINSQPTGHSSKAFRDFSRLLGHYCRVIAGCASRYYARTGYLQMADW